MAFPATGTKLTNLFNPQVVGDLVTKKLVDAIKFSPLARIDATLVARPGSTISLPAYTYIGDATTVNEGADIPIAQLTESPATVTVTKAGRGVQITDEAVLSGFGDPMGEAIDQLALAIASKVDNDVLGVLSNVASAMTYTTAASTLVADDIADALVKFGEDIDGEKVLLISPADYAILRKADDWCPASELSANLIIKGTVGEIHGCQVVVTNKLATSGNLYIVKPGALAIYMKRDVEVEADRDIINKSTVITADEHYAPYLYDASKAIKIVKHS